MPSKDKSNNQKSPDQPPKKPRDTQSSRKSFIWIFSFVILVVIVVTFIGAPALTNNARQSGGKLVFGKYAGQEITYAQGNYFYNQVASLAQNNQDTGSSQNKQSQLYQIWRGAFDRTVFHVAALRVAKQSGVAVSESAVDAQIAQNPRFQENGQFSVKAYNQASAAEKYQLRQITRENLIQQQYIDDTLQNVDMSDAFQQFIKDAASPERKFRYVSYSYSDFPDSKVVEYGKANSKKFERINLSVITVRTSESDANSIYSQLQNNTASFSDLAKAHSADVYASKGGDMGWVHYYELVPDFSDSSSVDKVFALKAGELSGVLKANYGWVIYRVNDAAVQPDFTDKDTVKTVRDYMNSFERGVIEDYLVSEAKDFKSTTIRTSWAEAAAKNGLKTQETDFFPINYGGLPIYNTVGSQSGSPLSAADGREDFFRQAFGLEGNQLTDPIVLNNNIVVLQLEKEQPAQDSTTKLLDSYMPFIMQQFESGEVQQATVNNNLLADDFNATFSKYVLPTQAQQ